MMGRRAAAVLSLVALLAFGPTGASVAAQEGTASADEVAALAMEAVTSEEALADLRQITEVDGRPVDLRAATADMGSDRAVRLTALAEAFGDAGSGASVEPGKARQQAEEILDDDKFNEEELPKPFKGALEWLADLFRPIGRLFEPIFDAFEAIPGGEYLLLALLAAGLGWLTWWLVQRRSRASVASAAAESWRLVDPSLDPEALDREADSAHAAGDHSRSVRLRYEAGIVRLARAEVITLRPDTTPSGVARQLAEPVLDDLTSTFEVVVYGGRVATEAESVQARTGWLALTAARSGR